LIYFIVFATENTECTEKRQTCIYFLSRKGKV
jgi:hypothetical protein